jgi:hypothetical protein
LALAALINSVSMDFFASVAFAASCSVAFLSFGRFRRHRSPWRCGLLQRTFALALSK